MNREQAQEILAAYRPGTDDEHDPLIAEARQLARTDPTLKAWLEESLAFDASLRSRLSRTPAPAELRLAILSTHKIIRPAPWWNPRLTGPQLAAAAAVLIALALAVMWRQQQPTSFAEFRREIADQSWRSSPHVEVKAASLADVRVLLAERNLSTNFVVPPALVGKPVRGCTLIRWQGHDIPEICFSSQGQHLHLIVVDRQLFPDAPTDVPQTDQWQSWRTASWSKDEHTYLLAGLNTSAFVKKFRKDKRWDWGG